MAIITGPPQKQALQRNRLTRIPPRYPRPVTAGAEQEPSGSLMDD